ncbi:MAG: type II toxin-antitoxin system VapC family toxin [Oceanicaulis sp.]|nr:type II toxin-antitoxin system VapC family toxin [Oceanicaulis sp.]
MTLMLDSAVLMWWQFNSPRLSAGARAALDAAQVLHVSPVSVWELAIKAGIGKLPVEAEFWPALTARLRSAPFALVDISLEDAISAGFLPRHHGDPFDRLIAAQAMARGFSLVSPDAAFDAYAIERVW